MHGVEQVVVVHAGQGEQRVDAVPEQGIDGGFGGGHAWHGWSPRHGSLAMIDTESRRTTHRPPRHAAPDAYLAGVTSAVAVDHKERITRENVHDHVSCRCVARSLWRARLLSASAAAADTIHIGMSVSTTGPAASLGIPQRNTVALLPKEIAGQTVEYFVLDDGDRRHRAASPTCAS